MKLTATIITILTLMISCKKKEINEITILPLAGKFDQIVIIPCQLKQFPDNSYRYVTAGRNGVSNMEFNLLVLSGSSNITALKSTDLFQKENVEIGQYIEYLVQTDVRETGQPDLEQEIINDYKNATISNIVSHSSDAVEVKLPYRTAGIKNFTASTLESWRGNPPGSSILDQGYLITALPPHVISAESMQLLYGYIKQPNYSPNYGGIGQIKEWVTLKPTMPPVMVISPSMHSETYGEFSFVVTVETLDNKIVSDTCKIKLSKTI